MKQFLSGALLPIPNYKHVAYCRQEWQAVEANHKIINYWMCYFIIGFPLPPILQLSAILNTIVHYCYLVTRKIPKNFPVIENYQQVFN